MNQEEQRARPTTDQFLLSSREAGEIMKENKLVLDVFDPRSAVEYVTQILICIDPKSQQENNHSSN